MLDEPTASLSGREVENLFRIIAELKQAGVGMIYISHRLDELPRIADRVTVLRDGHYVGTHPIAAVDRNELIRLMVGRITRCGIPKNSGDEWGSGAEVRPGCRQLRLRDVS